MNRSESATAWASARGQETGFSGELVDKMIDNCSVPTHVMLFACRCGCSCSASGASIAVASIYDLKPRFQSLLRPMTNWLAAKGVTANQVTVAAAVAVAGDGCARGGLSKFARRAAAGADGAVRADGAERDRRHARPRACA